MPEITITLTDAQAAAITMQYGTTDYLKTYCVQLADHLASKQASEAEHAVFAKIITIKDQEKKDKILADIEAAVEAEKPVVVEPPVEEPVK
jgi:hypothetical protein